MNPFLESTLAQPTSESWSAGQPIYKSAAPMVRSVRPGNGVRVDQGLACRGPRRSVWSALVAGLSCLAAPMAVMAIDVNAASADQLESVQGIGPKTAQIIVQERERAGRYESLQDLSDRVKGIGPKRIVRLAAAGLTVGGTVRSAVMPTTDARQGPVSASADAGTTTETERRDTPAQNTATVQERLKGYFRR